MALLLRLARVQYLVDAPGSMGHVMPRAAARLMAHPASERSRSRRLPCTQPPVSGRVLTPRQQRRVQSSRPVQNLSARAPPLAAALLLINGATKRTRPLRPACQSAALASTASTAGLASIGMVQQILRRGPRERISQ